RGEAFLGREEIAAAQRVEPVAIRPVLVHRAPGIGPIVVDIAAEKMAADAPDVLVGAEPLQMIVPDEDVVDILDLEGEMIEPGALMPNAEERVMVGIVGAAIAAAEGTDEIVGATLVDIVGSEQPERLAKPLDRLGDTRRRQHGMADALHMRRTALQAEELA